MKKGYRLSANQAYFNYCQLKQAQFGVGSWVDNAANTIGSKLLNPLANRAATVANDAAGGSLKGVAGVVDPEKRLNKFNLWNNRANQLRGQGLQTGVGYGALGLGALGTAGAAGAGYNALNGRQKQQQMY